MASTSVDSDSAGDDSIDFIDTGAYDGKSPGMISVRPRACMWTYRCRYDGKSPGMISVLHDGKVGWVRRLASKSRLLRKIYSASHRVTSKIANFIDNHNDLSSILLITMFILLVNISLSVLLTGIFRVLIVIPIALVGLLSMVLITVETDNQHAYPSGLILSAIMNGQPFIISMNASIRDDARMIEGEYVDRWKLARKYTRYLRTIEKGTMAGCEVCSPYEISDESMNTLSVMAERTMWMYVAHHNSHGGYVGADHDPAFDLVMGPSIMDTLDGFDEMARRTDTDHVERVESSLLMRLSLMQYRVADMRRMGESIGANGISEVCDDMDEFMDRIRDYDARWHTAAMKGKTDVMDAGLASIMSSMDSSAVSEPGLYLDSMASVLGVLDARITDLGEQLDDIARDQRDAEDLVRRMSSLSEDIAVIQASSSIG